MQASQGAKALRSNTMMLVSYACGQGTAHGCKRAINWRKGERAHIIRDGEHELWFHLRCCPCNAGVSHEEAARPTLST